MNRNGVNGPSWQQGGPRGPPTPGPNGHMSPSMSPGMSPNGGYPNSPYPPPGGYPTPPGSYRGGPPRPGPPRPGGPEPNSNPASPSSPSSPRQHMSHPASPQSNGQNYPYAHPQNIPPYIPPNYSSPPVGHVPPTTTATSMSQNMPHQGRPGVGQSAGPPGGGYMSRPNQNFGPYGSPHGPSSPQARITELPPDSPQKSYQSPSSPNRPASPVSSDDSFGPAHSPGRPFDPTSNIISHPDIKPIHYSEPKCWCQVKSYSSHIDIK